MQRGSVRSAGVSRSRTVSVLAAKTASGPTLAIVGITGAVGQEFLTVGPNRDRPITRATGVTWALCLAGSEGAQLPLQLY